MTCITACSGQAQSRTLGQMCTHVRSSLVLMGHLLSFLRLRLWLFGLLHAGFRVDDRIAATSSENKIGVLFLELCEVLFSSPYPWRVGFEQQIDFLCSLETV
jgi:hypothetical protein